MIKTAFRDDFSIRSKTFGRFKRFNDGQQLNEDYPCSGRPSTFRNYDVVLIICQKVWNYHRLTVREFLDDTEIVMRSCHQMLRKN